METPPKTPGDDLDIQTNKDVAAFSYIWIMSVVVFFARRNSPFAQFHSKQGLVLFALSFVWILPLIGHVLALFVVFGMVLGFIHAAQGKRLDVPFVGPLSRGQLKLTDVSQAASEAWSSIRKAFDELRRTSQSPPAPHPQGSAADPLDTGKGSDVQ